jgi:hypothetical protein
LDRKRKKQRRNRLNHHTSVMAGAAFGGGGSSSGRPVAIIVTGPEGVTVKPVFDFTKIILAGMRTWGTMLMLLRIMR